MTTPFAEQIRADRTIADARVRAILERGVIWDEAEYVLMRSALPDVRSGGAAIRLAAMLYAYEYGQSEDAA